MTRTVGIMLSAAAAVLAAAGAVAEETKPAAPEARQAPLVFAAVEPLSKEALGEERAKAKLEIDEVTINTQDQDGVVAGNAAVNTRTGGNTIGDSAFVGAGGFINAVQNTGNNVLIQSSTIINVSVEP